MLSKGRQGKAGRMHETLKKESLDRQRKADLFFTKGNHAMFEKKKRGRRHSRGKQYRVLGGKTLQKKKPRSAKRVYCGKKTPRLVVYYLRVVVEEDTVVGSSHEKAHLLRSGKKVLPEREGLVRKRLGGSSRKTIHSAEVLEGGNFTPRRGPPPVSLRRIVP